MIYKYNKISQTDDLVYDLSWFIEFTAYNNCYNNCYENCPRRQGFERELKIFLEERKLKIVNSE